MFRFRLIGFVVLLFGLTTSMAAAYSNAPMPRLKPEAPGPVYLSRADYHNLDQFFDALDHRQYSVAASLRKSVKDPIGRAIADWAFIKSDNPYVTLADTDAFIKNYGDWPLPDTIRKIGEEQITDATLAQTVLNYFEGREPYSGHGKLQLARAYFETGQEQEGIRHLRSAWINHSWKSSDEKKILHDYGHYLTAKDHIAKADRQLFRIEATNTKRLLPLLPSRERAKAAARIALLRRDANAVSLFENLSAEERKDAGVLHAVTRYYRRGREEAIAIQYALQAPLNAQFNRNPSRWWAEKRILARWALKNGRYEDAYGLSAFTGLEKGAEFADAEFFAGWVALRFLNDPASAEPHFRYLYAKVNSPISKARAQYWLGRSAEAKGDETSARLHYLEAASFPFTYYGQLAAEKIGNVSAKFPAPVIATTQEENLFNSRPMVHAMKILSELDRESEFINFARRVDDNLTSPGEVLTYDRLVREQSMAFLSVRAAKAAVYNGAYAPHVSWPHEYVPAKAKAFTEEALILGLTRQESEFNVRAYSRANARGLMQLLPSTARLTARKEGLPYSRARLLDDPHYNMTLGAAHLKHLRDKYNDSYILTLVAYNAGPNRVTQWIETYGDPRHSNVDPIDWVEMIPFSETRNYVQRVLENVQIYRARIEPDRTIAGQLGRDLTRGGSTSYALERSPSSPVLQIARRNAVSVWKLGDKQPTPKAVSYTPPKPKAVSAPNPKSTSPSPISVAAPKPAIADELNQHQMTNNIDDPVVMDDETDFTIDDCQTSSNTASTSASDLNTQALLDYLADEVC